MIKKIQVQETAEREIINCDWCNAEIPYRGHGFTCLSCGKITCSDCCQAKKHFHFFEVEYGKMLEPNCGQGVSRERAQFCSVCIGRGRDKLITAMFKDVANDELILAQFREYRKRQIRDKINNEIRRREKRFGLY